MPHAVPATEDAGAVERPGRPEGPAEAPRPHSTAGSSDRAPVIEPSEEPDPDAPEASRRRRTHDRDRHRERRDRSRRKSHR